MPTPLLTTVGQKSHFSPSSSFRRPGVLGRDPQSQQISAWFTSILSATEPSYWPQGKVLFPGKRLSSDNRSQWNLYRYISWFLFYFFSRFYDCYGKYEKNILKTALSPSWPVLCSNLSPFYQSGLSTWIPGFLLRHINNKLWSPVLHFRFYMVC